MGGRSSVFVGDEYAVVRCASIWLARRHKIAAVISKNGKIREWAEENEIPTYSSLCEFRSGSVSPRYDWLFSVANFEVLPADFVAGAREGAANFHDGPLPRHAGLNAPVWALLEGDSEYAITWHLMAREVDAGDILVERRFAVSQEETALTLNARCLEEAVEGFDELVRRIETGRVDARPQEPGPRSFHARHAVPEAAGRLDFTRPAAAVAGVVRALHHGRYYNPVAVPKIEIDGAVVAVAQAREVAGGAAPGTVLKVERGGLMIACGDGAVELSGLSAIDGTEIDPRDHAQVGDHLGVPSEGEARAIERAVKQVKPGDDVWRLPLSDLAPARLAQVSLLQSPPDWQRRSCTPGSADAATMALALALLSERTDGRESLDLAVRDASASRLPGYVSDWVPLRVPVARGTIIKAALTESATCLEQVIQYPAFCSDLPLRDPNIRALRVPDLGISLGRSAPVTGTAMTLSMEGDAAEFHFDANRIDPGLVDFLIARLEHLGRTITEARGTGRVTDVPSMPESERSRIIDDWNKTERDFDAWHTIHRFFEEQAERTPEAPALAHRNETLSYADLNKKANRVAHRLIEMGVRPGVLVGLSTHRSPLMVIAALAIVKAGGAYVPLDPSYPDERLALYLADSGTGIVVTENALAPKFVPFDVETLVLDSDPASETAPSHNPSVTVGPDDLAYVIFTSGSTGRPKGVMINHRNVANFFAGMDDRIGVTEPGVWLAVTSISFDISILELFWTLARGFKVVLYDAEGKTLVSTGGDAWTEEVDLSLFFWGHNDSGGGGKYDLLLESAQFADANGFRAVWIPERHFHDFGGQYPNPSVTAAAVSVLTRNIHVRAGSCVAPLHHPARIAEEWAVVDNLSHGRAGLAIASGWQPNDFLLRPENKPPANKPAMFEAVDILRRLWRGEAVGFPLGPDQAREVVTQPRPLAKDLPLWLTTAGNPDTWRQAGEKGMHILTHLLGQSVAEVAEKIGIYHQALREAGYDPKDFTVTLMLHTFIAESRERAMEVARGPMKTYLRSSMDLVKEHAASFPAFKRRGTGTSASEVDLGSLSEEEIDQLLDHTYARYFDRSGLFGSVEDGMARIEELRKIGVTEIACLVDIGIAKDLVHEGLQRLAEVLERTRADQTTADSGYSIASEIAKHRVTHLQCTPSLMRMMAMTDDARASLTGLKHILLGGEPLPEELVATLMKTSGARLSNMYGPTETTIWSTTADLSPGNPLTLGRPIANTFIYLLDPEGAPVPVGALGEIWIGGAGVAQGYWNSDGPTKDRFKPNPFGAGRIYRTGDMARWKADGTLQFVGRNDHQIKLRGYRVELGEIEAAARSHGKVREAIARVERDAIGEPQIALFVVFAPGFTSAELRDHLARHLPDYMVPTSFLVLDRMPLTPNGKIDRDALVFDAGTSERPIATPYIAPQDGTEKMLAEIWQQILNVPKVGADDDFFELGGDSLSALEASLQISNRLAGKRLSMTEIFQDSVLANLAKRLDRKTVEQDELEDLLGVSPRRARPALQH